MHFGSVLVLVGVLAYFVSVAKADSCGEPPLVGNAELEAGITTEVSLLSQFLNSIQLGGQLKRSYTDILSRYPDAPCVRANQFFQYQVCLVIMAADDLNSAQKLEELRKASDAMPRCDNGASATIGAPQPLASVGSPGWTKDEDGGCYVWNPKPAAGESVLWSGPCRGSIAWGWGTEVWTDASGKSSTYTGDMRAGRREGRGTLVFRNGARYEGQFANDERTGLGTHWFVDGSRYEGHFADGVLDGQGTLWYSDGTRHEGSFENGKITGYGIHFYSEDKRCEGRFSDGALTGRGRCWFPEGARYEGEFDNDKIQGQGVLWYSDGARYEGNFVDGTRNGQGIYISASGFRYQGEWKDGRANGMGTLVMSDGARYKGIWKGGCFKDGNRRAWFFVDRSQCR